MNRKLKALGLALFAAFAMSAVAAQGASAVTHDFRASANPTHLGAVADPAEPTQKFYATTSNTAEHVDCNEVGVNGTVDETETSVTVEPSFGGCTAFKPEAEVAAFVTTNGCHFTFNGETTADPNTEIGDTATVDIACDTPEASETGITVDLTVFKFPCIHIPPQEGLHGIKYKEIEENEHEAITVEARVHGIYSETTENAACNEGVHEDGYYEGKTIVTGYDEAEKQVDVTTVEQ